LQTLASIEDLQTATTTPHLVCVGSPYRTSSFLLIVDGKIVIRVRGLVDGVCLLLLTYYVLWLEYPLKRKGTYCFLQEKILEQSTSGGGRLGNKVVRFIEKINASV
jgi:hypothetical protein